MPRPRPPSYSNPKITSLFQKHETRVRVCVHETSVVWARLRPDRGSAATEGGGLSSQASFRLLLGLGLLRRARGLGCAAPPTAGGPGEAPPQPIEPPWMD
eukprot:14448592-Alexandrium_andersonii.AAC.1